MPFQNSLQKCPSKVPYKIVITTHFILLRSPGQLLELVEKKKLNFQNLKTLVVDGVDQMLDEGFDSKIFHICRNKTMPDKGHKQLLMFSTTMPISVIHLSHSFLKNHIFVTVNNFGSIDWKSLFKNTSFFHCISW